jgi:hypothetical protein
LAQAQASASAAAGSLKSDSGREKQELTADRSNIPRNHELR